MISPLISVIMPAYNAERTIQKAVDSVLNQTYRHIELLIIDDGSSDRTLETANACQEADQRIRVIKNEKNLGVAETRNRGVAAAKGTWIAFLDSDDEWTKDKLERQMACAEETKGRFIFTGSGFMDEEGNRRLGTLHAPERITYRELLKQNVISCSSVLMEKELALRYRMEGEDLHEDFAVWLRILRDGETAYGVDAPLLIYRMSAASKSGNKWNAAKMTYRVYRYVGLGRIRSAYYWLCYVQRSMKKYNGIR